MAEGTSSELIVLQRSIERSRQDVGDALEDLEAAARRLVSADHWRSVAVRVYRKRPLVLLAIAGGMGFWAGRRVWPRVPF